jgi:hypothetical protein
MSLYKVRDPLSDWGSVNHNICGSRPRQIHGLLEREERLVKEGGVGNKTGREKVNDGLVKPKAESVPECLIRIRLFRNGIFLLPAKYQTYVKH